MSYRAGIIGCGRIAFRLPDNHFRAYTLNPDCELVALCDLNKPWEIPNDYNFYNDYQVMVEDEDLDIVSICTPPETHCDIVRNVVPYVKAIYLEKPISLNTADATNIIKLCEYHDVILQVNHQRLFMPVKCRISRGWINTGTHLFSLLDHLFKPDVKYEIEYLETEEPVFEVDVTHNRDEMIAKGVEHLVDCLKNHHESISDGYKAREALRRALECQSKR